jgi:hypothetical protein
VVERGETCDPKSSCPTSCNDNNACTTDQMTGGKDTCNVACTHVAITACIGADGCCPAGCNATNDSDCKPVCGNGVVETGETCDPNSTTDPCPTTCPSDNDPCTTDALGGTPCNVVCNHTPITACKAGDGCCPTGCNTNITNADSDCPAKCGNGVVETGETCDPNSTTDPCPTTCPSDGDPCTSDEPTGTSAQCNVACTYPAITTCVAGDGCCPPDCTSVTDSDCTLTGQMSRATY